MDNALRSEIMLMMIFRKKGNNNSMDSNNKNKKDKFIKDSIDEAEMVINLLVGRDAFKIRKHTKKNM